jgi:hypothetical protein
MSIKLLKSDKRTTDAIKRADQIAIRVRGGVARKGTPLSEIDPSSITITQTYRGFFRVTDATDAVATKVTVAEGRFVLGLQTVTFSEDTFTVSQDGYLYIDLEYDDVGDQYTTTLAQLATWPGQAINSYKIVVAYLDYTAPTPPATVGSVSITQFQFGAHYGAGRVF